MPTDSLESYARSSETHVLASLKSQELGLSDAEARERIKTHGPNTLGTGKKHPALIEFLRNFKSPLIIILICISVLSYFLGEGVDAVIVASMVVMSVGLNFFIEHRASKAAAELKSKVAQKATVIRNGKPEIVRVSRIAVGDIVELNAGDMIPADVRIISSKDLYMNQSILTGESFPIEKHHKAIRTNHPDLADFTNIAFAGTSVVTGTARGVVVQTGKHTQLGQIASTVNEEDDANDFTRGIEAFSLLIMRIVIVFVVIIFLVNTFIKHDLLQSLMFAIAVAVGLTPEFLPMIMTVNMSRGSIKMANKGAIVKRLTAIPTFGSMNILCTDKTGTLTEDKIKLIKYVDVYGKESETVFKHAYLNSYFQTGITNPMDKAVVDFKKADIHGTRKLDEIPFDFERKRMSVAISSNGKHYLITKGAPEEILRISDTSNTNEISKKLTAETRKQILSVYEDLSREGFRVLGVCFKEEPRKKIVFSAHDEKDMSFLGFIAFMDPPKKGVRESIDKLEEMGIEVKVITGDNELVSMKICKEAGITVKGMVLGHEIDGLPNAAVYEKAVQATVFARFSPAQKNRIISILRLHGMVVGYMGDGINDVPSLKAADVGISVANGVDVAKETADIILTNKNLDELADGVIEGRKTFGNTMKYIMMGLSSNFGNMFSVLGAVLFLPFLPMLPIQILLNNFLYDISQITLPFDRVDDDYIKSPKRWDMGRIRNFMFIFGPISSAFDFLSFYILFLIFKNDPASFQTGWFIESLATQTLVIHVVRTRKMPFLQSSASLPLWITTIAVVVFGWVFPFLPIGKFFGFAHLPLQVIGVLATIVAIYLVCVEIGKWIFYHQQADREGI